MSAKNSVQTSDTQTDYSSHLGCTTIPQLFRHQCRQYGSKTAHREKDRGIWNSFTWSEYFEKAQWLGLGMKKLGLERGEVVSILSEDIKEWLYFDMAATCVGAIPSGVYTTDSASQLAYLVNDSSSTILVIENDEQLDKCLEVLDSMPTLKKVIVIDPEGLRGFEHERVMFIDELYEIGRQEAEANPDLFDQEINEAKSDEVRMLIYTSGTTGKPKGAMISHANIMFQINSVYQVPEKL